MKSEICDLLPDPYILLLNVHNVSDVGQIEVHTVEVPGPSRLEVELSIKKL
jgi:hypothetical protein